MKKTFFLIFAIFFAFMVQGQTKKAEKILDDLSMKIKSYESFFIDFTYEINNPDSEVNESDKGKLLVQEDNYRLSVAGQVVICDGETIWTYIEEAEEVQINSLEDDDGMISPSNILTFYDKNYKSKFLKEEKIDGKIIQIIELKPIEDRNFAKVDFFIDKEKLQMVKIIIFDKNDGTITYTVDNFLSNIPTKASDFTFNEEDYPGVEVIDMR
jgi:outer membrane lipoprotein-sorting protein